MCQKEERGLGDGDVVLRDWRDVQRGDANYKTTVVSFQVEVTSFHKKVVSFHAKINSISGNVNKTYTVYS